MLTSGSCVDVWFDPAGRAAIGRVSPVPSAAQESPHDEPELFWQPPTTGGPSPPAVGPDAHALLPLEIGRVAGFLGPRTRPEDVVLVHADGSPACFLATPSGVGSRRASVVAETTPQAGLPPLLSLQQRHHHRQPVSTLCLDCSRGGQILYAFSVRRTRVAEPFDFTPALDSLLLRCKELASRAEEAFSTLAFAETQATSLAAVEETCVAVGEAPAADCELGLEMLTLRRYCDVGRQLSPLVTEAQALLAAGRVGERQLVAGLNAVVRHVHQVFGSATDRFVDFCQHLDHYKLRRSQRQQQQQQQQQQHQLRQQQLPSPSHQHHPQDEFGLVSGDSSTPLHLLSAELRNKLNLDKWQQSHTGWENRYRRVVSGADSLRRQFDSLNRLVSMLTPANPPFDLSAAAMLSPTLGMAGPSPEPEIEAASPLVVDVDGQLHSERVQDFDSQLARMQDDLEFLLLQQQQQQQQRQQQQQQQQSTEHAQPSTNLLTAGRRSVRGFR